jgi:hypothetical protein
LPARSATRGEHFGDWGHDGGCGGGGGRKGRGGWLVAEGARSVFLGIAKISRETGRSARSRGESEGV